MDSINVWSHDNSSDFRRHFLVRAGQGATLGVSGTVGLVRGVRFCDIGSRARRCERQLIGVVVSELNPATANRQRATICVSVVQIP